MKFLVFAFLMHITASLAVAAAPDPMQYGRAFMAEGDYAAAAKNFAEALRLNPSDAIALNNLAVAKAAGGEHLAAMELLVQARRAAPNRTDIQENMASMQAWTKTYSGARSTDMLPNTFAPEPVALWPVLRVADSSKGILRPCRKKPCK